MSLLVHICCGPCAGAVLEKLLEEGHTPVGFFYNPNIHPLAEYMRRREGAARTAEILGVPIIFADALPLEEQHLLVGQAPALPTTPALPPAADPLPRLRLAAGKEVGRCPLCIGLRLRTTALFAKMRGFEAFTTTLLYSRRQPQEIIVGLGTAAAAEQDLKFLPTDRRPLWQRGIELSKQWGVYRQQYCGCVFSEYDRYARELSQVIHPDKV